MSNHNLLSRFFKKILVKRFSLEENLGTDIGYPKSILVVRQHNQFGDMLASVSLFRAIKEKNPNSELTVIVSPDNFYAVTKNKFIDETFIFDKSKLLNPFYFRKLRKVLKRKYDLVVVPATVSLSFTSCLLGRLANGSTRIGPKALNGKQNLYAFMFDRRVPLDWRKYPDSHISDFGLEIVRPFGISTKNYRTNISFDKSDVEAADSFLSPFAKDGNKIIGIHIGAGKPPNRWSLQKFVNLIHKLNDEYSINCYLTGSSSDNNELNFMKENLKVDVNFFVNKSIPEVAALISLSDLFITNDTGIMHVAGATETPQISIFGPTNPFNWAPLGSNKYFVRKSELIDDITVGDVFNLCITLLSETKN